MILGLTIGTSTIGWTLLDVEGKRLVAQGVRVFPTGTLGDIESGRDVSRNDRRQAARQHRVQLRRRAGRLKRLFMRLQEVGWLPPGTDRHAALETVKRSPYELRTRALDERLEPYELGRVIYHIAHRRGFKSNRLQAMQEDEELGVVKTAILELETAIRDSGARTLGEYLYRLEPSVAKRRRWTGRSMYVTELGAVLDAQARLGTPIGDDLRRELMRIVFEQKPPKSQVGRIGPCSLETRRKRMALAHPLAQEFRMLQKVNDLRAVDDLGVETVAITPVMRERLIEHLRTYGKATFAQARKVMALPRTVRFNFEREDEKSLLGDRTRAVIGRIIALDEATLSAVLDDLLSIDEEKGLQKRLREHWGFEAAIADALAEATLEAGHLMHSRKAVAKLLPLMRTGTPYATAVKSLYPHRTLPVAARDTLPLVRDAYPYLANPLVGRALGELRKVVHAIIGRWGKPDRIHVELHRHLQSGPKRRKQAWKQMRANHEAKEEAAKKLLKECGTADPTSWQIERWLLADECGWKCPFTGKTISHRSLIREESSFYVLHLVPFGMSLDDDWRNKTLAHVSVGEKRKQALLSELWTDDRERDAIAARFAAMQGPFAKEKLRRFRLTREEAIQEYDDAYAERFLESSSYVACLAREYLAKLYGTDEKVLATRGRITSFVREAVGLSRERREMVGDYRHHILDAVAVGLTTTATVRRLCAAATVGERRRFGSFPAPWTTFVEDVKTAVHRTTPSFRISKRVRGPLHQETFYGRPMTDAKGTYHLSRKTLLAMTKADVELVAGKHIQKVLVEALKGQEPKKVFADPANLPRFNGNVLRGVRVIRREAAFTVGGDRYVTNEQNHHALVSMNCTGWKREIVSLMEAKRRLDAMEPVFQDGLLSISPGELFQVEWTGGTRLIRVRSVSKDPRVAYVRVEDCRKIADLKEAGEWYRESVEQLRRRKIQKVNVTVLGEIRRTGQVDGGGGRRPKAPLVQKETTV